MSHNTSLRAQKRGASEHRTRNLASPMRYCNSLLFQFSNTTIATALYSCIVGLKILSFQLRSAIG